MALLKERRERPASDQKRKKGNSVKKEEGISSPIAKERSTGERSPWRTEGKNNAVEGVDLDMSFR